MTTTPTAEMLTQSIFNATVPAEGPKALRFNIDFTAIQTVEVDLTYALQNQKQIQYVQTVYVDNLDNTAPIIFEHPGSLQRIAIPAGYQAYLPILSPNPPKFVFQSAGAVVVRVFFLNIPIPPSMWAGRQNALTFDANGFLQTTDVALDALITNQGSGEGLNVNVISGGGVDADNLYRAFSIGTGLTSDAQIGPSIDNAHRWVMTGLQVMIEPTAFNTSTVAGLVEWNIQRDGQPVFGGRFWLPGAAPTLTQASPPAIVFQSQWGFTVTSPDLGDECYLVLSEAISDGRCYAYATMTETT